ncbi:MAG TPA: SAF domain-containing protein [Nocardioides sp.]|nr:SAF domain-containing protein [Nocardioides sp.]
MEPRDSPARSTPLSTRLADALASVRRRVLRRRRPLAVALAGVAVAASLHTLAPPAPRTAGLLVAARDLPAGHTLAADDLAEVAVPPGVVPDGAAGDAVGRLLAAPLRRGEAVTDVRLVGAALTSADPGTVALPVRLSDAGQAALLEPGDRIDLLATDPRADTTTELATGVSVLAVPAKTEAADGALPGRLVVLGVASGDVHRVTAAAVAAFVTFTWSRS